MGKAHGGRIDTVGPDDNNLPVIIEYADGSSGRVHASGSEEIRPRVG
jgi:hypothetical protein